MKFNVSILDDDPLLCLRLEKHLLNGQFPEMSILFWTRPEEFLSESELLEIDLLFLDVEMPVLNGFAVLEKARQNGFTGTVIFVTAYDKYILEALRKEAFDFLLKPIDPKELHSAIERFKEKSEHPLNFDKLRKHDLTKREIEIIELIFRGLKTKQIADKLFISPTTVNKHRTNILSKTKCKNVNEVITLL